MAVFETLIALVLAAVLLSLLARKIRAPYPALLALGGAAVAFLPWAPEVNLEPQLALALFIAPILLNAAYDSSPRDLKDNAVPLTILVLVAVALTIIGVAAVAKMLVPALPWGAALALGAIVAPPDAASATAVMREVKPPHRIRTLLEGESLFNDAPSLLVYRLAVVAAAGQEVTGAEVLPALALATVGSVAFGVAAGWLYAALTARLSDAPSAILLQFVGTFGVWIVAEHLHLSAVIAVVVYGLTVARRAPRNVGPEIRVPAYAVWNTVVFALNALAFLLVGLQIGPIVERAGAEDLPRYALFAGAILLTVIGVRVVWIMTYNSAVRLKNQLFGVNLKREQMVAPTFRSGLVVSWAGMRGMLTLATAYALPSDFPERDLLVFAAFSVVLGTLVLQGLTLGPLIRVLRLADDGAVEGETREARIAAARAAIAQLGEDQSREAQSLRLEYQKRLQAAEQDDSHGRPPLKQDDLRARAVEAEREAVEEMHKSGDIGSDAYYQLEEELDRQALTTQPVER